MNVTGGSSLGGSQQSLNSLSDTSTETKTNGSSNPNAPEDVTATVTPQIKQAADDPVVEGETVLNDKKLHDASSIETVSNPSSLLAEAGDSGLRDSMEDLSGDVSDDDLSSLMIGTLKMEDGIEVSKSESSGGEVSERDEAEAASTSQEAASGSENAVESEAAATQANPKPDAKNANLMNGEVAETNEKGTEANQPSGDAAEEGSTAT